MFTTPDPTLVPPTAPPPGLTAQQLDIWDGCCLSGEELEPDHDHNRAANIAKVGLSEAVHSLEHVCMEWYNRTAAGVQLA